MPSMLRVAVLLLCAAACTAREDKSLAGRPFVAAITTDPGQLNTAITTNGSVHTAAGLFYNGLIALDSSLNPMPELATRWDIENGGALAWGDRFSHHLPPCASKRDAIYRRAGNVGDGRSYSRRGRARISRYWSAGADFRVGYDGKRGQVIPVFRTSAHDLSWACNKPGGDCVQSCRRWT